jgi:hypothetical protein
VIAIRVVAALALLLATLPSARADDPAEELRFQRLALNTGAPHPELCLRFSAQLDPAASVA